MPLSPQGREVEQLRTRLLTDLMGEVVGIRNWSDGARRPGDGQPGNAVAILRTQLAEQFRIVGNLDHHDASGRRLHGK